MTTTTIEKENKMISPNREETGCYFPISLGGNYRYKIRSKISLYKYVPKFSR